MESVWENLQVSVDALPQVEAVQFQRHPVRYRTLQYVVAAIWLGIPLAGWLVWMALAPALWLAFAGAVLLALTALKVASIHYGFPKRGYSLRQNDLTYRKGWLFYETTTVPFNRIQHTEVTQGPLERKYKLCSLKIYTAGGSYSDLSVPGLEQEEAAQIRDFIAREAARYA
jgi:membrane protein YdbS with pleckstrin-like domain